MRAVVSSGSPAVTRIVANTPRPNSRRCASLRTTSLNVWPSLTSSRTCSVTHVRRHASAGRTVDLDPAEEVPAPRLDDQRQVRALGLDVDERAPVDGRLRVAAVAQPIGELALRGRPVFLAKHGAGRERQPLDHLGAIRGRQPFDLHLADVGRLALADLHLQLDVVGRIGDDLILDDLGLVETLRGVEPLDPLQIRLPGDRIEVLLGRERPPAGLLA